MKKLFFCVFFIFIGFAFSEDSVSDKELNGKNAVEKTEESLEFAELPAGYRDINLGMNMDAVKEALLKDSIFGYRGERDISLLPGKNRSLIETKGSSNIKRAWFQFYEENLYIIIIQMDTDRIDYYSMYSALTAKYGEPLTIDPKRAIWKNETVSMILERPLAIKYIDLKVFNELLEKSQTDKAYSDILREEFINDF
ncbi:MULTISPECIES: hypothetical protein [unclassified Treponema]|uniref:hypothetical protein n=1 Tax=unclassified Treponema TaxID=2638727 RepID=UPI0020A578F9|nr:MULTISPECIES: hypothetical protein [unclassified Treponema]UTC66980.1 hypothetical protein E4O06_13730 [Treponema sp. OMZ 789]UTC69710.1 hypothetical protein E4O01_13870 [Treponema sp. OMZ 790]UTC72424.1 hypothetical protein E4O02_13960 [Treponema sp. OMZ 791]